MFVVASDNCMYMYTAVLDIMVADLDDLIPRTQPPITMSAAIDKDLVYQNVTLKEHRNQTGTRKMRKNTCGCVCIHQSSQERGEEEKERERERMRKKRRKRVIERQREGYKESENERDREREKQRDRQRKRERETERQTEGE